LTKNHTDNTAGVERSPKKRRNSKGKRNRLLGEYNGEKVKHNIDCLRSVPKESSRNLTSRSEQRSKIGWHFYGEKGGGERREVEFIKSTNIAASLGKRGRKEKKTYLSIPPSEGDSFSKRERKMSL